MKGLSIFLQIGFGVAFGLELMLHHRLQGGYAGLVELELEGASLPSVSDRSRLEGTSGQTASLVYRWDPDVQGLRFRRSLSPTGGEWGHAIGTVRFDEAGVPRVTWHPFPLLIVPIGVLFVLYATSVLWLVEGQPMALIANPIAWIALAGFLAMQVSTAKGMLERRALPELAEVLAAP